MVVLVLLSLMPVMPIVLAPLVFPVGVGVGACDGARASVVVVLAVGSLPLLTGRGGGTVVLLPQKMTNFGA